MRDPVLSVPQKAKVPAIVSFRPEFELNDVATSMRIQPLESSGLMPFRFVIDSRLATAVAASKRSLHRGEAPAATTISRAIEAHRGKLRYEYRALSPWLRSLGAQLQVNEL